MFLSFSTKFPDGTPTDFVGKILSAYAANDLAVDTLPDALYDAFGRNLIGVFVNDRTPPSPAAIRGMYEPKIHTIRARVDRWRVGLDVQPVINSRTSDVFQFAPSTPFTGSQTIWMELTHGVRTEQSFHDHLTIVVDGRQLGYHERRQLIQNDGLDWRQFGAWFFGTGKKRSDIIAPGTWEGGIVHWTNNRY